MCSTASNMGDLDPAEPFGLHDVRLPCSVDRLILRVKGVVEGCPEDVLEANRHALTRAGWMRPSDNPTRVTGSVPPAPEGVSATLTFSFSLKRVPGWGWEVHGSVHTNANRAIRRALGAKAGPAGLGGRDNVVGPSDDLADRLPAFVGAAVVSMAEQVNVLLDALFAGSTGNAFDVSLQEIEVNRDFTLPDATTVAHLVQRSSLASTAYAELSMFSGADGALDRAFASTRLFTTKGGPWVKFYAKSSDLFRVEGCFDKGALHTAGLGGWLPLTTGNVLSLTGAASTWSAPLLAEGEAHVRSVAEGTATPYDLAVALLPLVEHGETERALPGRPPAVPVRAQSRDVYNQLWLTGRALLPGVKAGSRPRALLDDLSSRGVLVPGTGKFTTYALAPGWVRGSGQPT